MNAKLDVPYRYCDLNRLAKFVQIPDSCEAFTNNNM